MSLTYNHDDVEATESFETPRNLDHDDFEDNQSFEGPATDPYTSTFVLRAGLGDTHQMPVSLSHPVHGLSMFADRCHPRCRASNAHAVPRGASSSGSFPASIARAATSRARL